MQCLLFNLNLIRKGTVYNMAENKVISLKELIQNKI